MMTYEPGECPVLLRGRYVQDERYFAIEHMDVRREAFRGAHLCLPCPEERRGAPLAQRIHRNSSFIANPWAEIRRSDLSKTK